MASSNKYPWKDAPEWAHWAGTDKDGIMWWFEEKPFNLFGYPVITGRYAIIKSNSIING
jgi:hypothetical protein